MSVSILRRLQRGLETLYRVETLLDVRALVVNESERNRSLNDERGGAQNGSGGARGRASSCWCATRRASCRWGCTCDDRTLGDAEPARSSGRGLHADNFFDFCLAVEGVSHFIYVARCAAEDRQVSALEQPELQAEVDKFVSGPLCHENAADDPGQLRARLYDRVHYAHDLDHDERARYRTANGEARRYVEGAGAPVPALAADGRHARRASPVLTVSRWKRNSGISLFALPEIREIPRGCSARCRVQRVWLQLAWE